MMPEAVEAVRLLSSEEVAANLVVVTSADRLAAEIAERRLARCATAGRRAWAPRRRCSRAAHVARRS